MGEACWNEVEFVGIPDPGVDISPFPVPDDATAAIKEGNEYPAATDAETDWCPKRDAAAATAEEWDTEPGKGSWFKEAFGVSVLYKLENGGLVVELSISLFWITP